MLDNNIDFSKILYPTGNSYIDHEKKANEGKLTPREIKPKILHRPPAASKDPTFGCQELAVEAHVQRQIENGEINLEKLGKSKAQIINERLQKSREAFLREQGLNAEQLKWFGINPEQD